jgi:hypothetical protein
MYVPCIIRPWNLSSEAHLFPHSIHYANDLCFVQCWLVLVWEWINITAARELSAPKSYPPTTWWRHASTTEDNVACPLLWLHSWSVACVLIIAWKAESGRQQEPQGESTLRLNRRAYLTEQWRPRSHVFPRKAVAERIRPRGLAVHRCWRFGRLEKLAGNADR